MEIGYIGSTRGWRLSAISEHSSERPGLVADRPNLFLGRLDCRKCSTVGGRSEKKDILLLLLLLFLCLYNSRVTDCVDEPPPSPPRFPPQPPSPQNVTPNAILWHCTRAHACTSPSLTLHPSLPLSERTFGQVMTGGKFIARARDLQGRLWVLAFVKSLLHGLKPWHEIIF